MWDENSLEFLASCKYLATPVHRWARMSAFVHTSGDACVEIMKSLCVVINYTCLYQLIRHADTHRHTHTHTSAHMLFVYFHMHIHCMKTHKTRTSTPLLKLQNYFQLKSGGVQISASEVSMEWGNGADSGCLSLLCPLTSQKHFSISCFLCCSAAAALLLHFTSLLSLAVALTVTRPDI